MTREEAIAELNVLHERLSNPKDCEDGCYSWEDGWYVEAIDMAIEALQTEAVSREEYEEVKAYMDTLVDAFIEDGEELAESVKVVRCKDCRYSRVYQTDSKGTMQTYCVAFIMSRTVTDDDFCSWGERREP